MPRQSPDNTPDRDKAPSDKGFFERVAAWLDANELDYAEYPDGQFFALRYTGDTGDWRIIVDVSEGQRGRGLLIYSIYPARVPEGRRAAVAELFARLNYGLSMGNFELDWKDGEIRVRTSMPVADGDFSDLQLEQLFYVNLGMADRHMAGVFGVAFGNVTPALAIEMAHAPPKENLQ